MDETRAVEELRKLGWVVRTRPCSDTTIREVNLGDVQDIVPVFEVTCGCGYRGFNAAGMDKVYQDHLGRSAP